MNFGLISRLLGVIVFTLALAFFICFGVGFAPSPIEWEAEAREGFLLCAGVAVALSAVLFFFGRNCSLRLHRKEALCVIGVGWLLASAVGALPYVIIDAEVGLVDGFFESASGLTTTGASIYGNVEILPRCLLFWRGLSQWLGGMGVVVFFVAILGFLGAGAKILYSNEASGSTTDFEHSRVQSAVLNLWLVYLGLSAACVGVFVAGGMSLFDATSHMFTALSTGGFSTRNASFAAFESPFLEWAASFFMTLGGCSFVLLAMALRGRFGAMKRNTELRAYLLFVVCASLAITPVLLTSGFSEDWHEALRTAVFQVVSIMTTTGFASADFDLWPAFSKLLLLALMVIGGCSGSTAGGVKVARVVVAFRVVLRSVELEFRPHVIRRIQMNKKPIETATINEVMVFLVLAAMLCMISIPLAAVFEPSLSLEAAISAVFACLFNIGPGFAEVGPTRNFGFLHDYTKVFLSLLMIMGRLELYAILVLFSPALWRLFR
ncbi:MAG: TrkH family potassium uptake protein [Opitutaceae bacterium]